MLKTKDYIEVVTQLNGEIHNVDNTTPHVFLYETDGYHSTIKFNDEMLFVCSDGFTYYDDDYNNVKEFIVILKREF